MITRTRSIPSVGLLSRYNRIERRRRTNLTYPPTYSAWEFYRNDYYSYYPLNEGKNGNVVSWSMTDTIGNKLGYNPCRQSKIVVDGQYPVDELMYGDVAINQYQYRCQSSMLPSGVFLNSYSGHLSGAIGMITLAKARIPATCREDLQGLINFAEMGSTINSGASKLVSGLGRLAYAAWRKQPTNRLKRDFKKSLTEAKTLSGFMQRLVGAELEWKFGWKPLIKDLSAASNAFQRAAKIRAKLQVGYRVYGSVREELTSNKYVANYGSTYNLTKVEGVSFKKTTRRVTASIMRRIKAEHTGPDWQLMLPIYTELMGLKPSLSKAWDLVPLSFVVDWVLPVGNMIESWEGMASPQSNWIESYGGLETTHTITHVRGELRTKQPFNVVHSGGSATRVDYDRIASDLLGHTPPYLPSKVNFDVEPGKWFTGMELLLQRLLR